MSYNRHFGYKHVTLGEDTKGMDFKAYGDTTSKYIFWDASADTFYVVGTLSLTGTFNSGNIALVDAETLTFGTGSDVVMQWDGTNFLISAAADESLIEIGDSASTQKSFDLKWYANEASGASYLYFDASENLIYTTGVDLQFKDNDVLVFGTGSGATGDIGITYDANSLNITPTAASDALEIGASGHALNTTITGTLTLGADAAGYDFTLYGAVASYKVWFDANGDTNGAFYFGADTKGILVNLYGDTTGCGVFWNPSTDTNGTLAIGASGGSKGNDLIAYGTTNGKYMQWDQSADTLSLTGLMAFSGTQGKCINFASVTPSFTDADNAFIAIGTWNDALVITSQTEHFVPIQVHLESASSIAKDIAAARLRVNTSAATANTLTAVNVLEMRSNLKVNVGSHANLQSSTEVSEDVTCTGDLLVGYFSLQGDGNITCGNHVNVLEVTNTHTGTGVDQVAHFTHNSVSTITNVIKAEVIAAGTVTSIIDATNTGGTVTNGLLLNGTIATGILMTGVQKILIAGTSGTKLIDDTANVKFYQQYTDCGALSGTSQGMYVRHYVTGAGGSGQAFRAYGTVSDIAAADARGAHISLDFGATGTVTGSGQALTTTLHIADQATQGGTLSAITAEIYADGDTSDPSGSVLSCIRFSNGGGAGKADIDDDCALLHIDTGFTDGTGNMIYTHNPGNTFSGSIKIRIGGATKWLYYADSE
jgi:hypothetical protein